MVFNNNNKIFLLGFMGSGKSTIGRKLAKLLGYDFIDLDKLIELKAQMTIASYLQQHGETAFREFERYTLHHSTYPEKVVIATGGGTPCFYDTMDWLNKSGITIYISLPIAGLVNRLKNAKTERPLIKNMNEDELIRFITKELTERECFYQRANFMVSGIDLTAEKLVQYLELVN